MTIVYCLLILCGLYIILLLAPAIVMYKTVYCRKSAEEFDEKDLRGTAYEAYENRIKDDFSFIRRLTPERVTVKAYDGIKLTGYYYSSGSERLALCVHGYNTTALNCYAPMGRFFMERGYDVLLIHERGHGESEGKMSTLGIKEQFDVQTWTEWACARDGIHTVVIAGVSMGCTALSYASDAICDPKVKAMVLDCGYTSPYDQMVHDLKERHLPDRLLMPHLCALAERDIAEDLSENVRDSLAHTSIPALFMHGTADTTVPPEVSEGSFAVCASPKQLYIVPDAAHACSFLQGGEEAKAVLAEFLKSYAERV